MISFRQHIVTLVAVFLALAVGIVLGGGPLSDLGRDDKAASSPTREQRSTARTASYGDAFATATASRLYRDRLRNKTVAVVTMPGAAEADVSALTDQVEAAAGRVSGTYTARPALVATSQKSLVDTLGSQLMTQLGGGAVSRDATTYDRMGQLVGLAIADPKASSADATTVRESLAGAELMDSPTRAGQAQLVLVVLGDADTGPAGESDPAILAGLLAGLADQTTAVVVAGDTASSTTGGELTTLRSELGTDGEGVATVDGTDTPLGQVTAVLALIRSLDAPGGSFGASGSDGAVPLK